MIYYGNAEDCLCLVAGLFVDTGVETLVLCCVFNIKYLTGNSNQTCNTEFYVQVYIGFFQAVGV